MPACMRPIRFIATFLLCVIALSVQAASLWMANNVEVRRIDLTGETADLRVPLANVIHLAGARNGGAFALTKHSVTRIAADGGIGPSLDVEAIGYGPPSAFAIDAHDDTVWVVTHGGSPVQIQREMEILTQGFASARNARYNARGCDRSSSRVVSTIRTLTVCSAPGSMSAPNNEKSTAL